MRINLRLISLFILSIVYCSITSAETKDIVCTSGNLSAYISIQEQKTITQLNIKGSIDKRDFDLIKKIQNLKSLDLSGCTITAYSNYKANIIPSSAFYCNSDTARQPLAHIILPSSIESIGENAFRECTELCEITMSSALQSICNGAFANCQSLKALQIPTSVSSIGANAFGGCSQLKQINIPPQIRTLGRYTFFGCSSLSSVTLSDELNDIGEYCFAGATALTSISIPASTHTLGRNAFSGCTALTSASMKNAQLCIKSYAFAGCQALKEIDLPAALTGIEEGTFYNCASLTDINIPSTVKHIGNYAFFGCSNIKDIKLPETAESLGAASFAGCNAISDFSIPEKITTLPENIMAGCSNLVRISLSEKTTSVGEFAFVDCTNIQEILLPQTVKQIGQGAFAGCSALKQINLPHSITQIEPYTFYNCHTLSQITFGPRVSQIGEWAFAGCYAISEFTLPLTIRNISKQAFDISNTKLKSVTSYNSSPQSIEQDAFSTYIYENVTLYVSKGALTNYRREQGWREFTNIRELEDTGNLSLSVNYNMGGEVSINGITASADDAVEIAANTVTGIHLTPYAGYHTSKLIIENKDFTSQISDNTLIYTFQNNASLTAQFDKTTYNVELLERSGVTYSEFEFDYGSQPRIRITPSRGHSIVQVLANANDITSMVQDGFYQLAPMTANVSIVITTDLPESAEDVRFDNNQIKYWSGETTIFVESQSKMKNITVFRASGQIVSRISSEQFSYVIPVSETDTYIVKIGFSDGSEGTFKCFVE